MIEKAYELAVTNEKSVKRVILDENLHYIHMVFPKGEGLPIHLSNSNVYMTVVRGRLSIALDDQETHTYSVGHGIEDPFQDQDGCEKPGRRSFGADHSQGACPHGLIQRASCLTPKEAPFPRPTSGRYLGVSVSESLFPPAVS